MDTTHNLALPYIIAAQAQKHVTHNEALRVLDAVVQLMVLDKDLATPPGSPAEGARYIVAASPTGAWSGQAGKVAAYQDGAWSFYAPKEGWSAWVADEDALYIWNGTAWGVFAAGGGGGGGSGGMTEVVEDLTPQLGGDLDTNGFDIGFDDGAAITDDAGNEQIVFHKTASAVNQVGVTNAATGNAPKIAAEGSDTNIDLEFGAKGTGGAKFASAPYCPQATLTDGATINWNLATQPSAIVTLGGNRTLAAPTNQKAGATYILVIKQDATGGRTLAWNSAYKFPGGADPVLSTGANAVDVVSFVSDGSSMYGVAAYAFA